MASDLDKDAHEAQKPLGCIPPTPPPPPELPPNSPPMNSKRAKMAAKFGAAEKAGLITAGDVSTFRPCHFFLYGSLMDPEVLQTVTGLATSPAMRDGSISGFKIKMWGIYPALVPREGSRVTGRTCKIDDISHFQSLQQYETTRYKPCMCSIEAEDGEVLENSMAFCWAGDPESPDLEDGTFDLERYQKNFKSSIAGLKPV
ncbi:hypothetical protein F4779DRAFT_607585 [Xylariaceae sp. FL0662B]|nr:hypothetical protein F4779DRAFT_607585 [Xylariaceae sp. FL0662B]